MNSIIQGQLDRIDTALNTLVESIPSYNPSIDAATSILAADDKLTKSVGILTTHQANHARILALRSEVSSLNVSITTTITALASARADILSQKITPVSKNARQVPYKVLLDYAAQISRYTAPKVPRYVKKGAASTDEPAGQVNGADTNAQQDTEEAQDGGAKGDQQVTEGPAELPFQPWPTEATIKQGALGHIQAMVEHGQDPSIAVTQDTGGIIKDEKMTIDEMGDAKAAAPEDLPRVNEAESRPVPTEKPKVFRGWNDLYDPNDNMDDEV